MIERPTGWKPNPQALADISAKQEYTGHPELGTNVDTDTWLTPHWILDYLGKFDLDPAAADAMPDRCAPAYFVKADNGLEHIWHGRVWCNPPFSDTRPWIAKCAEHRNGITLVTASIESEVWRKHVWKSAAAVTLLHGRTRFCRPDGSTTTGRPLRSIALIAWSAPDAQILGAAPFAGVFLTNWNIR